MITPTFDEKEGWVMITPRSGEKVGWVIRTHAWVGPINIGLQSYALVSMLFKTNL